MKLSISVFTCLLLLPILYINGIAQQSSPKCDGIREKLKNLNISGSDAGVKIADLFSIGDSCISELNAELSNVDPQISHSSRLVMMYLRNKDGLKNLDGWQQHNEKKSLYLGPVPRYLPKSQRKLVFMESAELAKQVAEKLFVNGNFLKVFNKEDIKSKLLGFNGARNKALIEVDIADQVTHHIILKKRGMNWMPLMIVLLSHV